MDFDPNTLPEPFRTRIITYRETLWMSENAVRDEDSLGTISSVRQYFSNASVKNRSCALTALSSWKSNALITLTSCAARRSRCTPANSNVSRIELSMYSLSRPVTAWMDDASTPKCSHCFGFPTLSATSRWNSFMHLSSASFGITMPTSVTSTACRRNRMTFWWIVGNGA